MECQIELKLGKVESFGPMKMLKKFQAIWMTRTSTCFTMLYSDQKLGNIAQGKWCNGLSQILVEGVYIVRVMTW